MPKTQFSERIESLFEANRELLQFINHSSYARKVGRPGVSDFAIGNPQEMPIEGFAKTLQRWTTPQDKDWFAYKMSEPKSRQVAADSLRQRLGLPFRPEDIFMTNGAFGAIPVALSAITSPGDEVIYISPPWFFYRAMILSYYGKPVRVECDPYTFDLDIAAIEKAITQRTRAILVNSPNNPTGKIYPPETLKSLVDLLEVSSQAYGHPIYLLSDESYSHILYDGRKCPSPTQYYPNTFLIYTYGKTLLTPGQRIGYLALPPAMPDKEALGQALFVSQMVTGWAFPNALMQHALPDLERLSIDLPRLQAKRDRLVQALTQMGYELHIPEGTFYLMVRSPLDDDQAFAELLGEQDVLVLPGSTFEKPGYFRLSLTANDEMITKALPAFAAVMQGLRVKAS